MEKQMHQWRQGMGERGWVDNRKERGSGGAERIKCREGY